MTAAALGRPPVALREPAGGGAVARRAMWRWAWRLFRREWRQQLLVLLLIVLAVGATVFGAAVSTNTPLPANEGFGTAMDRATFSTPAPHLASQIAALQHRFGTLDVIEQQTFSVPGSIDTYWLQSQDPHGAFGQPLLSLVSGRYPATAGEVAVTPGVAADFGLSIGSVWHQGGATRHVVGIVQNPQSLLDEFALVVPGQVTAPTQVTVLFDAPGIAPASIGPNVDSPATVVQSNPLNPQTITLGIATLGMLLIGLVSVGGFTVLAQRRLRSLGMLGAIGATDRNIRLVVRANGVVAGVVGTVIGALLGFVAWVAYRPRLEQSSHHLFGVFAVPWVVVVVAMALSMIATYFAASRPARAMAKVPIVAALSGRPAPPKELRRSAVPGLLVLACSFLLFGGAGATHGGNGTGSIELVLGFVTLIAAVLLLSPMCLTFVARVGRGAPLAVRMSLRDLARYRARSGSALAAISLGVLIAMVICLVASARYGNVLDYVGPNLSNNELILYTPAGPNGPSTPTAAQLAALQKDADQMAATLGSHQIAALYSTSASLDHHGGGRQFNGQVYVATPQLLALFGINASQISPTADVLTMRPGLPGYPGLTLDYGNGGPNKNYTITPNSPPSAGFGNGEGGPDSCPPGSCIANPPMQELAALPSGTSAPNTVFTEHAVQTLHLQLSIEGWMIVTPSALTATQIHSANQLAAAVGMSVETKNSAPDSREITGWATFFGIVVALSVLAMTVGLIRSETAADLRTLTATGAGSATRRSLTAVTAGALALLGAVVGTVLAYIAVLGFLSSNANGDNVSELSSVPVSSLLLILLIMPLVALVAGWLLAGREPKGLAHQPLE